MRNISFSLTKRQFLARTKTVTRRMGWKNLKAGDLLQGCEKCMWLKKGEKTVPLGVIRVVSVRREPLRELTDNLTYGFAEIVLEGFGDNPVLKWPSSWVPWFCASHPKCTPGTPVTRIEFEYVPTANPTQ